MAYAVKLTQDPDTPRNWKHALNDPDWAESMKKEKDALKKKDTYTLTPRKPEMAVLKGLWRCRIKNTSQESIYKSLWVVDGSRQMSDHTAEQKWAPVAEAVTIRTMAALAATRGWSIRQGDFPTAYLNAEVETPTYVEQPHGLEEGESGIDMVWSLTKALYSMVQS